MLDRRCDQIRRVQHVWCGVTSRYDLGPFAVDDAVKCVYEPWVLEKDRQGWLIFVSTRLSEKRSFPCVWCYAQAPALDCEWRGLKEMEINERRIGYREECRDGFVEIWKIGRFEESQMGFRGLEDYLECRGGGFWL